MAISQDTTSSTLRDSLLHEFNDTNFHASLNKNTVVMEVPCDYLLEVAKQLKEKYAVEQLIEATAVDLLTYGKPEWKTNQATSSGFSRGFMATEYSRKIFTPKSDKEQLPKRYVVVYQLLSLTHNFRISIKTQVPDEDVLSLPSLIDIWSSANWIEREIYDMFGIHFIGHPDLRRLLTDYGFIGHPFRKDFPLVGEIEVRYDPDSGKVIQQPVSIEPRVLVPKVIRQEHAQEYVVEKNKE